MVQVVHNVRFSNHHPFMNKTRIQKQLHEMKIRMKIRNKKKYVVNYAQRERYRKSSIPSMQRLLNRNESSMNKILKGVVSCTNYL